METKLTFADAVERHASAYMDAYSGSSGYVQYLRRQSQDARAAAEHDRRIRVIRNQPRNPKARKYGRASVWNRSSAGGC